MNSVSSASAIQAMSPSLPAWQSGNDPCSPAVSRLLARGWRCRRRVAVLCGELILTTCAYAFSAALLSPLYGGLEQTCRLLLPTLPVLVAARLLSFVVFGSCMLSLRVASVPELICITKATSFGSLLFYAVARFALPTVNLPAALLTLDWTLSLLLLTGFHFGLRVYRAQRALGRTRGRRALIIGAGEAATSVVRDLIFDTKSEVLPVGLVDDDPQKRGTRIYGVPVIGGVDDLVRLVKEEHADEVLICVPSATRAEMRSILAKCRECGTPVRTLPSLAELVGTQPGQRDFRALPIEDLLQREPIVSDPEVVRQVVGERVVLVTGAGGSIGSELCRQIAAARPSRLLLLEKSENSLFYINLELRERFPAVNVEPLLVDLTCRDRVRELFQKTRPEVVFHAAAHKHVHLLELHPREAVRNNVLGTRNVALAAQESGTERFVNISTDKAVSPRNYMGLSKKMTELLIRDLAQSQKTRFMNVRFGNVAGSTGSVLRLFRDQIQKGGPLRITDPRATRYFMTIAEAVCLILHAAAQGEGGETFVFDMGKPMNIYEIARALTLFSGLSPGKDLPVEFIGLKEGEKINEDLWEEWEKPEPTQHDRILALKQAETWHGIRRHIDELEALLAHADNMGLIACLHRGFPEFATTRPKVVPIRSPKPPTVSAFSAEAMGEVAA